MVSLRRPTEVLLSAPLTRGWRKNTLEEDLQVSRAGHAALLRPVPPPSMRPTMAAHSALRHFAWPSIRNRRSFTSSFFLATFLGAIVTVSLSGSTILPCPAKMRREQYRSTMGSSGQDVGRTLSEGERVRLTRKGGWIEIENQTPGRTPQT